VRAIWQKVKMSDAKKPKILAPIQPNAGVRLWYYRELLSILEAAQFEILLELSLQLARQPVRLAADAAPVAALDLTMKRWAKKWTLKFDSLATDVAKRFATRNFAMTDTAMMGALKKSGFTIAFKPTTASRQAYKAVVAENVGLIKNLPSQYVTSVQSAVWQSVNKGADMAALSQKLRENFDISAKRAALISTDQNNKAKAIIENTRRQQLGIKRAIWQHSSAGKEPRPTHLEMNGKVFELSKGMFDPDANGKGKGEWIWPGQLINCRCTSRAIIPGLDE
jgi:uncharacterized protein with gpF-like domain